MADKRERRRGRPALPPEQRAQTLHVKVPGEALDALRRMSVRTGLSVNALASRWIVDGIRANPQLSAD